MTNGDPLAMDMVRHCFQVFQVLSFVYGTDMYDFMIGWDILTSLKSFALLRSKEAFTCDYAFTLGS